MFIFFMLDLIKSFWMFIVDKRNVGFCEEGNKVIIGIMELGWWNVM